MKQYRMTYDFSVISTQKTPRLNYRIIYRDAFSYIIFKGLTEQTLLHRNQPSFHEASITGNTSTVSHHKTSIVILPGGARTKKSDEQR